MYTFVLQQLMVLTSYQTQQEVNIRVARFESILIALLFRLFKMVFYGCKRYIARDSCLETKGMPLNMFDGQIISGFPVKDTLNLIKENKH